LAELQTSHWYNLRPVLAHMCTLVWPSENCFFVPHLILSVSE
jgi:hypothetical protein